MASTSAPEYTAALEFLLSRINYEQSGLVPYRERHFKLDRMRGLLGHLQNPQNQFAVVHLAGTKGKGSTASLIAAIFRAAGYRTGLFTSPHLERLEERFTVDQRLCPAEKFIELVNRLKSDVAELDRNDRDGTGATYFELINALAFQYFADQQVDVAIVEVGLGGRLDSTNVCSPELSLITSISHDHTGQLGRRLDQIAAEKAGIIKPQVPVISGVRSGSAAQTIERMANLQGSKLLQLGRDFDHQYRCRPETADDPPRGEFDFRSAAIDLDSIRLALLGAHQADNGALAVSAALHLRESGWNLDDSAIRNGLATATCPARIEAVRTAPVVVLDTAHNDASIDALIKTLTAAYPKRKRRLLIAISQDKEIDRIVDLIAPAFDQITCTRYRTNPRCLAPADLADKIRNRQTQLGIDGQVTVNENPDAAYRELHNGTHPDDLICITGSFFLAAELRSQCMQ